MGMAMMVVFLLALVLTTRPAKATDCMSAYSNILSCKSFLENPNLAVPGSDCCNAAKIMTGLGTADSLCQCLRPFSSTFHPSKAQLLPGLCNLEALSPIVKCLAPSLDLSGGLRPPLVPLPPLPLFPLPPLPSIPLPPLPLVPPLANSEQQKDVKSRDEGTDGLLPPLPLLPLPPLPDLPLPIPPLPNLPLPPLPNLPLPPLPNLPIPPLPNLPLPPLRGLPLPPLPLVPPVAKNVEEKQKQ